MAELHTITHKEDLLHTLDLLEEDTSCILFQNCQTHLKVGNREINVHFPSVLYLEQSWDQNVVLLLPENGEVNSYSLERELSKKNITCHEVDFAKEEQETEKEIDSSFEKEIVFVQSENDLMNVLQGQETAIIYPKIKGSLAIKYGIETENKITLDQFEIIGALELDDKLVLFHQRSFLWKRVFPKLWDLDIISDIEWSTELPYFETPKEYKKEQN